jgi:hypothetical protein
MRRQVCSTLEKNANFGKPGRQAFFGEIRQPIIEIMNTDESRVDRAVSIIGIEKIDQPAVEFGISGRFSRVGVDVSALLFLISRYTGDSIGL